MSQFLIHIHFYYLLLLLLLLTLWFRVRVSHPPIHVTYWSCDHEICKKSSNFSKVWLTFIWPQPSSHVTHLSCNHVLFVKRWSPVSQRQWPFNFVVLRVKVKGHHLLIQVTCWKSDCVIFEKRHLSTNARPQHSAGDIKNRKTHKPKNFFIIQKNLTFDSNWYTPLYRYLNCIGK